MAAILASRSSRLMAGFAGIALIAYADLSLSDAIPLALLYIGPIVLISPILRRWQILLLGLLCTLVAEGADGYPFTLRQGIPRDLLYLLAYTSVGLYVSEVISRRRVEQNHVVHLVEEVDARRVAEEQLSLVVANSSIAIITCDDGGTILQSNEAAERMFRGDSTDPAIPRLCQSPLSVFLPSLARVQIRRQGWEHLKTMMQSQGLRANQDPFLAEVWMSSYVTSRGGRLTAMIVDSSSEVRDREEANLEQVLAGSKLAIGAFFHEIRNICAAIAVVQQNLRAAYARGGSSEDFDALQQLVTALQRMASHELSLVKRQPAKLNLDRFLRDLRILLAPSLRESGVALRWQVAADLPEVWADQQSLLQVFLNLARNAESALAGMDQAELLIAASRSGDVVQVAVSDNGPGVRCPDQLFRPFAVTELAAPSPAAQNQASGLLPAPSTGLGLYLSRAMMVSFHGDLLYRPTATGATFVVRMLVAET